MLATATNERGTPSLETRTPLAAAEFLYTKRRQVTHHEFVNGIVVTSSVLRRKFAVPEKEKISGSS